MSVSRIPMNPSLAIQAYATLAETTNGSRLEADAYCRLRANGNRRKTTLNLENDPERPIFANGNTVQL